MELRNISGCFLFLLISGIVIGSPQRNANNGVKSGQPSTDDGVDDFVPYQGENFNDFDWNLFKVMARNNAGNVMVSPISLKLALVLLYEGAEGLTAEEIANTMHLPVARPKIRERFASILQSLTTPRSDSTLNLGTRLYVDSRVLPRQRYGAIVKAFYGTEVVNTNLSDTHNAAEGINNWVKNITMGKIPKIIDNEQSLKDSMMVITSAMYFKGNWRHQPFSINRTEIGKFRTGSGKIVDAPIMRTTNHFYFSEIPELNSKILRIPYTDHKLAMYFVLPNSDKDMNNLLNNINSTILGRNTWLMQDLPVDVAIPKFKFDTSTHLENQLRDLGIRNIFDQTAVLTGIVRTKYTGAPFLVTDILQKAGIEVNEEGSTAYVATEVQIGNKIGDETFHAYHPFLFYIEDESTGTILYMGVVNDPLQETGSVQSAPNVPNFPPRFGGEEPGPQSAGQSVDADKDERSNYFSIELIQKLSENSEGNVIVAPANIKAALMLLSEGTDGRTKDQLLSALRLPHDDATRRDLANRTNLPSKSYGIGTALEVGSRLWVGKGVSLAKNYTTIVQRYYSSEVQVTDFSDTDGATKAINDWVRDQTHGHINKIVEGETFSKDTKLFITSAVYFKGLWLKGFDRAATRIQCFHRLSGECKPVFLMENLSTYQYAYVPALDANVIEIPYTGQKVSMLVLLPKKSGPEALRVLIKDMSYTSISALLGKLYETEVKLQLPRFSVDNKQEMRIVLEQLGIKDIFSMNGDFSPAFGKSSVQVGSVLHNAKIDVNEVGTVAAAVTGISIVPLMGSVAERFRADRPFIFFLIDRETSGILFAGRVVEPVSSS